MSIPQQQAVQQSVQQPSAPQSNDEAIGSFARDFLQEIATNDDPDQIRRDPVEEVPQETQDVETQTEELAQEAETPTQPEIPLVEVDIDGEKFNIPEKVKHRVMADKDYRQKTMEVAAERKQLQAMTATAAQIAQQAQQLAPYHAQLSQMDSRAQYLHQAMQQARANQDPLAFNEAQGELGILLNQRDKFASGLERFQNHLNAQQHELRVKQLELDAPKLIEQYPDLRKPEINQKLVRHVQESGLPEVAQDYLNYCAPGARMAYESLLWREHVASQGKAKASLQEKVKNLPPASQGRAAERGAKDKQLHSEWQKRGGKINDPAFTQLLRSKTRG